VQGLTVGPMPKPLGLFKIILFNKKDFPVLYNPATDTTPIGPYIDFKNSIASSFT